MTRKVSTPLRKQEMNTKKQTPKQETRTFSSIPRPIFTAALPTDIHFGKAKGMVYVGALKPKGKLIKKTSYIYRN